MSTIPGARILILGINYGPETTGIAPYTTKVATHLAGLGADVRVVTGVPHYPQWRRQDGARFLWRAEDRDGVRVMRAAHWVPTSQSAVRRAAFEASWLAMAAPVALRQQADAVVAVSPALAAAPLARAVAARTKAPWALVVQDVMGAAATESGVSGGARIAGVVGRFEAAAMRSADLVGVIGEGFRRSVVSQGVAPERTRLLPNWTHIEPSLLSRHEARRKLGWPVGDFLVVHTGNMGLKQGLEHVVASARRADAAEADVVFVLVGEGNQRAALQRGAAGVRRLRFVPPVDDATYPLVLAAADVLLVNERPGVNEMCLPSKLTSYLAAGRPILAAVSADGWTAEALHHSGAAVLVEPGNPDALLLGALRLSADPDARSSLGAAGPGFAVETYSEEAALARYEELVEDLLLFRGGRARQETTTRSTR